MKLKWKVGSFCSGVEGGTLALDKDKYEVVCLAEIDQDKNRLLKREFPDVPNFGDIFQIDPKKLPLMDVLLAGISCQPFSEQGKRLGFDDPKNGSLFLPIAKIIKGTKPKVIVIENVKGLATHDSGKTLTTMLRILSKIGYYVDVEILNARNFGVRQERERVFIVGVLEGQLANINRGVYETVSDFLGQIEKENINGVPRNKASAHGHPTDKWEAYRTIKGRIRRKSWERGDASQWEALPIKDAKVWDYKYEITEEEKDCEGQKLLSYSKSTRKKHIDHRYRVNDTANTLVTGRGCLGQSTGNYVLRPNGKISTITINEAERFMGWPTDYTKLDNKGVPFHIDVRFSMVGEGIVPQVVESLFDSLLG